MAFLSEATKARTSRNSMKHGDLMTPKPAATVVSGKAESRHEVIHPLFSPLRAEQDMIMVEGKCLSQERSRVVGPLKSPASLKAQGT